MAQRALIRSSISIAATFAIACGYACTVAPAAWADTPTETVIPAALPYSAPEDPVAMAGPGGYLHKPPGQISFVWTKYTGGPDISMPGRHTSQPGNSGAGSDVVATQTSNTSVSLQDMDAGTTTTVVLPTGQRYLGTFGSSILSYATAADNTVSLHVDTMVSGQLTDTPVSGLPAGMTLVPLPVAGDAKSTVLRYSDSTGPRLAVVDLASATSTPVFGTVDSQANAVLTDSYIGWYATGGTTLHLLPRSSPTEPETTVQVPLTDSAHQTGIGQLAVIGNSLLIKYQWWGSPPDANDGMLGFPLYTMPLTGGTPTPIIDHAYALSPSPTGAVVLGGSSLSDWGLRQVAPSADGTPTATTLYPDPGGPSPLGGLDLADGQLVTIENGSDPNADVFTRTIQLAGTTPSYGPHTALLKATQPSNCTTTSSCAPPIATGDGRIAQLMADSSGDTVAVQQPSGYSTVTASGSNGTLIDSNGRYVIYDSPSTGKQYIGDVTLNSSTNVLFARPITGAALWESTLWVANATSGSLSAISLPSQQTTQTVNTGATCVPSELQAAAGRWIYWSCGAFGPAGVYDLATDEDVPVPSTGPAQLGDGYVVEHDMSAGKLELTDVHTDTATTSDLAALPAPSGFTDDRRVTWAVDKFPGGGIAYTDAQQNIHIVDPHIPATPASGNVLLPGQRLNPGQSISSGSMRLVMQTDGNLVAYLKVGGSNAPAEWASGTYGHSGAYAIMQNDGNLVVYRSGGGPGKGGALWASNTAGSMGAYAMLQDDGNFVVYRQARTDSPNALWASGSYARPQTIASGQTLKPGWWTQGQRTFLVMQPDGNLVMYRKRDGAAIWSTRTYDHPGAYAIMQNDGNLVVYRSGGGPGKGGALWASGTYGHSGAYAIMQNDGNLVIYRSGGGPSSGGALWATNTWRTAS